MLHALYLRANGIYNLQVLGMSAEYARSTVLDEVDKLRRAEPVIDRNQYRSNLRDCVEGFQLSMGIRRDIGDAIARPHPSDCSTADQRSQRSRNSA